jgi:hypothetical protein
MSLESDLQELLDYRALLELKYRYCWCVDTDDVEGFADVFTDDAVLTARYFHEEEPYLRREGRDELRTLVRERQETLNRSLGQHRPYNPLISIEGDEARGKWYMTAIAKEGDGRFEFEFGEYHERYRRVDGDWKITRCAVEYLEMAPELVE